MPQGRLAGDHAPEFKHVDDMEWEMGRFNNKTKFLFHPRLDRPTEPNVGLLRYEPGASFPLQTRLRTSMVHPRGRVLLRR